MFIISEGYVLSGALVGLIVGMTGVGGGAMMTPLLILFFHVSPVIAVATDLWFAMLTKSVSASFHSFSGNVDWSIVRRLWMGSLPISLILPFFMTIHAKKITWLTGAIGFLVLLAAVALAVSPTLVSWMQELTKKSKRDFYFPKIQISLTILSGLLLGVLVLLTSVGAGVLGTLILFILYPVRLSSRSLIATETVHSIPLAFFSGLTYFFLGKVNLNILINLLIGSIPMAFIGSALSQKVNDVWLKKILAFILCVLGLRMIF